MSWLERARPMPRLSMQAFCEDGGTAEVVQMAAANRHLCKSQVSVGVSAAVAHDQDSPAPNLIVIETGLPLA
jgi:pilus assembly protein CpaE